MAGSGTGRITERRDLMPAPATALTGRFPRSKRLVDLTVGTALLVLAVPILVAIRATMLATRDQGPFLYRARRVGEGGLPITVLKIRTMTASASGAMITSYEDQRVTRVGRKLRRTKLDELPQLWNVVRGDMTLVGPRPEDPGYVDWDDAVHRRVFRERPGITGLAQLEFRDEAALLDGPDPERRYREEILPAKLALDLSYLDHRSVWLDLSILARTAGDVLRVLKPR